MSLMKPRTAAEAEMHRRIAAKLQKERKDCSRFLNEIVTTAEFWIKTLSPENNDLKAHLERIVVTANRRFANKATIR